MTSLTWISSVGLLILISPVVHAQKNANQRDEKRENQRVANAERELSDVRKELSAVQKSLKVDLSQLEKHESSLVQLRKTIRQVREEVEDRLGEKLGLPKALQKQRTARAEFDKSAAQVIANLAISADWKSAKAAADSAKEERKALLEDVELEDDERNRKLKKIQETIARQTGIEQDAISKDPVASKANSSLQTAQSELDALRKQLPKDKIDSDAKVVQLEKDISKKQKELSEVEVKINKHRSEANKLQRKMIQSQTALKNAKAADAADSNRNKPPKK